ncbi:methyltransferase-like protein 4 [Cimex lectularius]|uniref:Methyltransferase-like protein 4 n=1 Tax=Cimex lectularius TaxID=79782 RepID=A0A8I6RZ16_CIMLE|nr:methyltransferase-like protein 4 [Cimex lectularius]
MSIVCRTDKGWVVSHYDYTKKIYTNVLSHSGLIDLTYNKNLFNIITPLMRDREVRNFLKDVSEKEFVLSKDLKRKGVKSTLFDHEIKSVENLFIEIVDLAKKKNLFLGEPSEEDYLSNNRDAREFAERLSSVSHKLICKGGNNSASPLIATIEGRDYVIPSSCLFFSCDIRAIEQKLDGSRYDFVLLDPPWRNKFVRRKKLLNQGYDMLSNDDIKEIPISKMLNNNGLVGVWCTNAPSHIESVKETLFEKWGLEYCATWFWVKVTRSGEPICPFYRNHSKKPYERIIFGHVCGHNNRVPEENKIIVSVPSSVHSHKPPLPEILSDYLPNKPKCIELFARYLLPGWTSVGDQVLSLQYVPYFETDASEEVSK